MDRKAHWENIYTTKSLEEVSWYQPLPQTSLDLIASQQLSRDTPIIDIGGGDSFLVDHLLELGFEDTTVLDISSAAIERAKQRLGVKAAKVHWIVSDITDFKPERPYGLWHDRAAFHFLTSETEIRAYVENCHRSLASKGILLLGTFSEAGPTKCSGIEITQYSQTSMTACFADYFETVGCHNAQHPTPFGTIQDFTFCVFSKR